MALTYVAQGFDTLTRNGGAHTETISMAGSWTPTGSNALSNTQLVNLGSWQALNTGSCVSASLFQFDNNSSGSIAVATDAAGTKQIAYCYPNGIPSRIAWSGSAALYAQAFTSASYLDYVILPI